jgi:hypothetical protein
MGARLQSQPGYPAYQPASYQLLRAVDFPSALDRVLAIYPAAQTTSQTPIQFNVRTPNVRMRTRVVLALVPTASTVDTNTAAVTTILDPAPNGKLWGAIVQRVADNTLRAVPTRNIEGTKAAPTPIPTDTGLWGWELEIETCGDNLQFIFTPPTAKLGNTVAAAWHVLVNYEAVQRLTDEEWQLMRQGGAIDCGAPVVLT